MNRNRFASKLSWAAVLLSGLLCLNSCGDDNDDGGSGDGSSTDPVVPTEPGKGDAMSPAEQKAYMETVAREFMDLTPASDFKDITTLGRYVTDTYFDGYDWSEAEKWGKDIIDGLKQYVGILPDEVTDIYYGSYYNYYYISKITSYKAVVQASNFKGHFTATNGRWVLSKADDLQFIFNDKYGDKCVLKLETSGSVKKVYLLNTDEWIDYDSKTVGNDYYSYDYYDRTQWTIGVPEKVVLTLTQGGREVVKTTVNIDLGSISNEEFDLSKNSLNVSTLVEFKNGYTINVSQVSYTANSKVSVQSTMSKNGKDLVVMALASDLSGIPSCNVSAFTKSDFDIDDYDTDKTNGKNAFVKLDILGKIQIQGTISDIRKYADYLEQADENDEKESNFKSYLNQANALTNVNMFYDGNIVRQASVTLEPFEKKEWDYSYWTTEPVLVFYDGSSYSTFEAFFNDRDFKTTIEAFKTFANKYADLVGEHIYW